MKVDVCPGCAGFCSGVQKAVDRAFDLVRENGGEPVDYNVPVVHNPQITLELESIGFQQVHDGKVGSAVFCGSAHGLSPEEYQRLEGLYSQVVDTTCRRVRESQELVTLMSPVCRYIVILATKADHPEALGLLGYVDGRCKGILVTSANDPRLKEIKPTSMVGLVTQSTVAPEAFSAFEAEFVKRFPRHIVTATLCPEILARRAKLLDEAGKSDYQVAVIAGGKNSANTQALADTVRERYDWFLKVLCIEDQDDPVLITKTFLDVKGVILASGTSTPIEVVEAVAEKIRSLVP